MSLAMMMLTSSLPAIVGHNLHVAIIGGRGPMYQLHRDNPKREKSQFEFYVTFVNCIDSSQHK
jgi:hypothetical protein